MTAVTAVRVLLPRSASCTEGGASDAPGSRLVQPRQLSSRTTVPGRCPARSQEGFQQPGAQVGTAPGGVKPSEPTRTNSA